MRSPPRKPAYTRTEDVIYGGKFGTARTLDAFEPVHKNGAAVIWIVSSGLVSDHSAIRPGSDPALLERGYTVFAAVHGSRPRVIITETYGDVHRAVHFVRTNASRWGVDPNKFGTSGGSAGGVRSLILGTQGGPGKPDAKDPVDRAGSAVLRAGNPERIERVLRVAAAGTTPAWARSAVRSGVRLFLPKSPDGKRLSPARCLPSRRRSWRSPNRRAWPRRTRKSCARS